MFTSDLMTLEVVCSDYGSRIVKKKKLYFAIFALYVYGTTTSSNENPSKFLTGFNLWKHIYQRIDKVESSQKHKACVEAHIRFSSNKTVIDLLTVSQISLHNK